MSAPEGMDVLTHSRALAHAHAHTLSRARGLVLPVLLVLMALMGVLVTSLWRSAITRESLAQADADRLQSRQAARALIREAQQDIVSPLPGTRHTPGPEGASHGFYPADLGSWPALVTRLQRQPDLPCLQGICLSLPTVEPALGVWRSRLSGAALPGQFVPPASGSEHARAQLFPGTAAYWVELLPFDRDTSSASTPIEVAPGDPSLVYRITVFVQGRLPGTQVLQQLTWLSNTASPERANAARVLQWREWLE